MLRSVNKTYISTLLCHTTYTHYELIDWHWHPNFTCALRPRISDTQSKPRSGFGTLPRTSLADHRELHQQQQPSPLIIHPGPQVFQVRPWGCSPSRKEASKDVTHTGLGILEGASTHYSYYRFHHASRWLSPRPTLPRLHAAPPVLLLLLSAPRSAVSVRNKEKGNQRLLLGG